MRHVVKSAAGYYANVNLKPSWVPSVADAKVFPSEKKAKGVIRLLRRSWIHATVIKLPAIDAKVIGTRPTPPGIPDQDNP
jgi:hypothetical protein